MLFEEYTNFEGDKRGALREVRFLKSAWELSVGEIPQGTGEPVLFIPGYLVGNKTTKLARKILAEKGHLTFDTAMEEAIDFTDYHFGAITQRLFNIYEESGKKINLVGHSAGGIIARQAARLFPDRVGRVITLGSDFNLATSGKVGGVTAERIFDFLRTRISAKHIDDFIASSHEPPPVPTTSIFTEGDEFVPHSLSLNPDGAPMAENVNIFWTNETLVEGPETRTWKAPGHMGMLASVQALTCIADRLATRVDGWQRFDPEQYTVFSQANMLARCELHLRAA